MKSRRKRKNTLGRGRQWRGDEEEKGFGGGGGGEEAMSSSKGCGEEDLSLRIQPPRAEQSRA